ncbi:hypothetical protein [Streptomyces rhizosphaericus]|uniref:Uncharacterized protein n=1 Tax=Streptomyces rhizosphaericus TaxID=114699 RepID=A0A6G4AB14_9ACTN|nr:hypothetical protein [Streptomyces rhizosphaericus]NEW69879.1 hypothetical protein [Streptomyces rhizosphaericus]
MRPHTTRIDTARWLKELREWGSRHRGMRAVTRALERTYGPVEAGRISTALVERLLIRALAAHEGRLTVSSTRIEEILNRLMEDREALRGGGRPVRPGAEQTADLRELEQQLQGLATFEQSVREMINDREHDWQTALRNELETQLGLTRSHTPVTGASEIARLMALADPPRLRPGTRPELVAAADELLDALRKTPPAPVEPPAGRPYRARERVGTQSERVTEAAARMVSLLGGEKAGGVPKAVRLILAGTGDLAERNRMVIEVLVAHGRLTPGKSVPKGGPQVAAGGFQELVTGSSQEWTGHLVEPVRGHTTVGVDNVVGAGSGTRSTPTCPWPSPAT